MSLPAATNPDGSPAIVLPNGTPARMALERSVHDGASYHDPDLASWNPILRSADAEVLPDWNTLTARTREQVRNDGIASGAVQTAVDRVVGTGLRLVAKPDYAALGLSREWANEWGRDVQAKFRLFANDIDNHIDASMGMNFAGLQAQAYRSYMLSSEILGTFEWLPRRPDRYATAVRMVQPDRLSNPLDAQDSATLRGGVQLDADQAVAIGYHIRNAHESDAFMHGMGNRAYSWTYVPTFTPWGRRRVVHLFDREQPDQHRGKTGFAAVLADMRVIKRWKRSALQAAVINAMYAAVIESEMPGDSVAAAVGGQQLDGTTIKAYLAEKRKYNDSNGHATFNGGRITHLLPGEKFKLLAAEHPSANYAEFESATLRHLAAGLNMSYEEVSRDYSRTNYSSARAAMAQGWRFFAGRRVHIIKPFCTHIYACWLEEAISRGDVDIPASAPNFQTAKTAWCGSEWIGAPREHIDELKEKQARALGYGMFTTHLERECAEAGMDWQDVLEQRAYEHKRMLELGLDPNQPMELGRGVGRTGPKQAPGDGGATDDDTTNDNTGTANAREREEAAA